MRLQLLVLVVDEVAATFYLGDGHTVFCSCGCTVTYFLIGMGLLLLVLVGDDVAVTCSFL